ncbi:MAG: hypothetical protein GY696_40025 [Gammaproteobacteria bacterium]|nr:hypothetical protein [Gammaproteobacteria bacterium]
METVDLETVDNLMGGLDYLTSSKRGGRFRLNFLNTQSSPIVAVLRVRDCSMGRQIQRTSIDCRRL